MPAISVIMPARDVRGYIGLVLTDLREQRFTDHEVLVVDDGSTDGTREVIARVAEAEPRVRLLTSDGSGPSVARNLALDRADAQAIAFVDADDRLSPDYLDVMYTSMQATGSDVVVCNARRLYGGRTRASRLHLRACAEPATATHLRDAPQLVYDTTVWNKLIRRELWEDDGLRFTPGRWINDVYPSLRTHVLARRVDVLDDVLYYWRVREDPVTSITSSKYHDPAARLKSLEDRLHAVARSREMLAADLPDPAVRRRFDERVLVHDLWTYLPLYAEADRTFRSTLTTAVAKLLVDDEVDLAGQPLGPLLTQVYRAVLADDRRQLADLLAADTEVVARVEDDRWTTWVEPPPRRGRRGTIQRRGTGHPVGGRPRSLALEGSVEQVRLTCDPPMAAALSAPDATAPDATAPVPRLTLAGQLRLRDGPSDLVGDWQVRVVLRAGDVTVAGEPTALATIGDADLHPLRRSGWRGFRAGVDLTALGAHPTVGTWRIGVEALLDGVARSVPAPPNGRVTAAMVVGVPLDDTDDVNAEVDAKGRLVLRRRPAPARLAAAHRDGDTLVLDLHAVPGKPRPANQPDDLTIRLAAAEPGAPQPNEPSATLDLDGTVRLPLPALPTPVESGWQVWVDRPDTAPQRLRAGPTLATTRLATDEHGELVLRPTVKGAVSLTARAPRPTLAGVRVGADPALLELHGPVLHPTLAGRTQGGGDEEDQDGRDDQNGQVGQDGREAGTATGLTHLLLTDAWTGTEVRVPLHVDADGWHAVLPLPRLADGSASPATANQWRLQAADGAGGTVSLRVEVETRARFPLELTTAAAAIELRLNAAGRLRLFVGRPAPA